METISFREGLEKVSAVLCGDLEVEASVRRAHRRVADGDGANRRG